MKEIDTMLGRYAPDIEKTLRDAREKLRAHFPRGFELVFDNYNALVFAMSPTEKSRDAFVSVAGYPKWVTLFFLYGADLDDPKGLLEGTGKQVRSIRLESAKDLDRRDVKALVKRAIAPFAKELRAAPPRTTIVSAVSAKRRDRSPSR